MILLAFGGALNLAIASEVQLLEKQVGLWRRRWQQSFDALVAIECRETHAELRRAIEDVLSDAPRSGSPGTFTAEKVTQILAVACEPPEQSGRPIDRWTHRELADEVIRRGIVKSISVSQVGRYLGQAELQPHRSKYWLNTKEKDPEVFEQQVQIVCQTYREAPELYFQENTHTVSVDEMPGVQALERIAKTIPMQPGRPARIEYEYQRHGTQLWRSRFARGWLLWLLNDRQLSHLAANTADLPSHRACAYAVSTDSLLLTAAAMPATPPFRAYNVHRI